MHVRLFCDWSNDRRVHNWRNICPKLDKLGRIKHFRSVECGIEMQRSKKATD